MPAYARLTDPEIDVIRLGVSAGIPRAALGRHLGCDASTITYWAGRRHRGTQNKAPKPGKKARKGLRDRRAIVQRLAKMTVAVKHRVRPRFSSASAIADHLARTNGIHVTAQTVRNDLHALGFKNKARRANLAHGPADLQKRCGFARAYARKDASRFVFTDEKTFTCGDYTSRKMWVAPGAHPLPRDGSNTAQDTVYVWGAIGVGFRKLVVLRSTTQAQKVQRSRGEANKKAFDSAAYIRSCLAGALVTHLAEAGKHRVLQADNHRVHYSAATTKYLKGSAVAYTHDWPARSPDLNPIENYWAYLQERVSQHVPLNSTELRQAIETEFEATPQDVIDTYAKSFTNKCKTVKQMEGRMK
jgi:transposase